MESVYKFSELASLRKIDAEFWSSLEKNLQQSKSLEKVNLKPLIKLQKSLNNTMMKMIAETAVLTPSEKPRFQPDDVDEAEGPRKD
jgi:hypothetical protein